MAETRCNDCGYLVDETGRGHNVLCVDLRQARADHMEAEAYGKEMYEWLEEALNALGVKDVFEMRERFPVQHSTNRGEGEMTEVVSPRTETRAGSDRTLLIAVKAK